MLHVGASYQHDERAPIAALPSMRNLWNAWGTVGMDARSGDASLTLQWQAVVVDETAVGRLKTAPGFFAGRFALGGRIVVARAYDVAMGADVIPDGARVRAGFGWYPTKDLGLSLGGQVAHGQIYADSTTDYTEVLGGPSLSYWVGRRVQLSMSYAPKWSTWAQGTAWEHDVTMGITGRVPGS